MKIKVIGIDPGINQEKGTFIYTASEGFNLSLKGNGLNTAEMDKYLKGLCKLDETILICWASPLTGPVDPDSTNASNDYYSRPIEKSLSKAYKDIRGFNTFFYGGLLHWTISRALIGLPRVSKFDVSDNLPFKLINDVSEIKEGGKYIVEVHPVISIYELLEMYGSIEYKSSGEHIHDYCNELFSKLVKKYPEHFKDMKEVRKIFESFASKSKKSDALDAVAAYLTGELWVTGDNSVRIFGDESTGRILFPSSLEQKLKLIKAA
ncbi:MAG: DUF429 domain-containing protein [Bacteriovoracaceae bacterium]|nr:DUF429 domain-containing protein [Bacteriovoracaceae bacterium]